MARNRSSQLSEIGKPSPTTEERIKKGEIVPHNSPATQRGRSSKRASHEGRGSERESVNYQVDTESGIDLGLSESGRYQEWRPSTAQQEEWIRQGAEQYRKEQQEKAKAEAAAELKQSKTIEQLGPNEKVGTQKEE